MNNNTSEKGFFEKIKKALVNLYTLPFFRRGGYALIITALVLAVLILLNYGVSVLSKKVDLEYDLTSNNLNSISAKNEKYLKSIEEEVNITVCASKEKYVSYVANAALNDYMVEADSQYLTQTLNLLEDYENANDNIAIKFVDPQSSDFALLNQKYASYNLKYGDIIVTSEATGQEKVKHIIFTDIYPIYDASGYAAAGYGYYSIYGNNLENVLSSAISYVLSEKEYKAALLTGHSNGNSSSYYEKLLTDNNFVVENISDSLVTSVSADYDVAAIIAPTSDFINTEIEAISNYLDNNGKGGKTLMFFGDTNSPTLPNLYEFLSEWGINVDEGILFETSDELKVSQTSRSALASVPATDNSLTKNYTLFITGYNLPLTVGDPADDNITVTGLTTTSKTVVKAPVGAPDDYSDYTENDLAAYSGIILAAKSGLEESSSVLAFGSVEYIDSEWAENENIKNKDFVLSSSKSLCGADKSAFSFVAKSFTNMSYIDKIDTAKSERVRIIFVYLIPILVLILGIFVYIRRRRAR